MELIHQLTIDVSPDAFVGMDGVGRITDWNPAAEVVFGLSRDRAIGQPMADLIIPERFRPPHLAAIARFLADEEATTLASGPVELSALRADGSEFPVEISFMALRVGGQAFFRAFIRDISARKILESELLEQALTDGLTGLSNQGLLADRLAQALAGLTRPDTSVAVFVADIDRFKAVNEAWGRTGGDDVIRAVGQRLRSAVRPRDTVARLGGDDFVVVCEETDEFQASILAHRMLIAFEEEVQVDGQGLAISISIGIAVATNPDHSPTEILRNADAAMYHSKELGGNRAEILDEDTRQHATARLGLERDLRQALDHNELFLEYQPLIDLETGMLAGVEALARWRHPVRGIVAPLDFIPLAEETGLIIAIGKWVLRTACAQAANWTAAGHGSLTVAVNLSTRQLADPDLVPAVEAALAESEMPGARVWVEITESSLMRDTVGAEATLMRLRELGIRMAVDDFGTGYSSLLYLRGFPVQQLKIDRSFVSGLGVRPQDTAIVRGVIDLAHALGLEALAEGVENQEQLDALIALGCEWGQGYLWSKPLSAVDLSLLLASSASRKPE